ncbi:glycosyltransferase family 2 protein [Gorillibacterium sp. sgz5001074]|uniref:glycosyltransferase family 2 protein n=1 Tax=Gorillibacterium sp. sgz5001074 TaxID=3446695 RepID=UPI003F66AD8E
MDRVSVIIPVYNSMRTLKRCVDSILGQSRPVCEIILADNGGTDETRSYFADYHPLVTYTDMGEGITFPQKKNATARLAQGDFLLFIDSDMYLEPGVVEECLREWKKGHRGVIIPERSVGEGFWARCKRLERDCYWGDPLVESARFVSREDFERIGGYDPAMIAAEDMDFHNRILGIGTVGRTGSIILHDEGNLQLSRTVKKKGYYGGTFEPYKRKYPELARKQFGPYRLMAFVRNWRKLLRHPILTVGVGYMKWREFRAFKNQERLQELRTDIRG